MRVSSLGRTLGLAALALLICRTAQAQYSDYDPEYDDGVAAGELDYSDEAAAGYSDATAAGYSDAEAAGGPQPAPGADGPASADATLGDDTQGTAGVDGVVPAGVAPVEEDDGAEGDASGAKPWEWGGARAYSNLTGPTGGFYTIQADSAEAGTFGLGLHGSYFKYRKYIYGNDLNVNMWAGLNLRVTPIKYLEIFTGLESRANYNNAVRPELFQALGDFSLGVKGFYDPIPAVAVGGLAAVEFKNPVGEVDVSLKGASFPLGLISSFDFRKINEKIPLRAHLNFIYRFDNSSKLVEAVENRRGGCGKDMDGDGDLEFDGCLNAVERVALDIDRTDQFRIGVGIDAILPYVTPIVEYNLDIPINRQDYTCPNTGNPYSEDECMKEIGIHGMRMWFTFGVKVLPPLPHLSVDLGVDLGVTGYAPSAQEVAPAAPYRVIFGLAYNFDPFVEAPPAAPAPCLTTASAEPPPAQPLVAGYVHDADAPDTAVAGATVTYAGMGMNAQITDAGGRFRSYPMPSGPVTITISADGYEDASFEVTVPDPTAPAETAPTGGYDAVAGGYDATAAGAPEAAPPADGTVPPTEDAPAATGETPAAQAPAEGAAAEGETAEAAPEASDAPAPSSEPSILMEGDQMVVSLDCPLKPLPQKGVVLVRAVDDAGKVLSGVTIKIDGPSQASGTTNESGDFTVEVDPGTYTITAEKTGFFRKAKTIDAALSTTVKVKMPLGAKPAVSSVEITNKRIAIKKKIHFETNSDQVKADSLPLLDEIADVLVTHAEIKRVEIQGHTDNNGKRAANKDLSQRRAASVRQYLVDAGVAPSRLEAKGFGPDKPRAPNITAAGRAKNRRVEFHILERAE